MPDSEIVKDAAWDDACKIVEDLLASGDEAIFAAAMRDGGGSINKGDLAEAMLRTTIRLAEKIRAGQI